MTEKPQVGLLLGDPGGIGPEVLAKLLALDEPRHEARITIIGDPAVFARGCEIAGVEVPVEVTKDADTPVPDDRPLLLDVRPTSGAEHVIGEANAVNGRYALGTLRRALELAKKGRLDAICFAPLNKQALHMAGSPHNDELHFFAEVLGFKGYVCELNTFDHLWTTRVTSHVALADVAGLITEERLVPAVGLAHATLRAAGIENPRIGMAALNPHGGDGGLFGREEIDLLQPAIARMQGMGMAVSGPYPADTIFLKALNKEFDVVVTMYHDQGQIAMKLLGFERGVTVQGGLPIPITTPAHGTAFDIVGQGVASEEATRQAFLIACRMGAHRAR